jgi:hypothetical protein
MRATAVVLCAFLWVTDADAQTARPQILILGTYHMASPGRDIHNAAIDDVRSPKRQQEIAELIAVLKRFRPTKIAVEADVTSARIAREYADYLAGKYTLTANEIDQVGFRLAKELGHQKVYPVDVDGDFPYYRVRNYAIANERKAKFESAQEAVGARVKAQSQYLATHSILDHLLLLNADSSAARAVAEYYSGFMPFGEPWEYAGADLIASWFQRNLRIYSNVRALIESPQDRILVVYGSGHLGWLQQIVAGDAEMSLVKLKDVVAAR